MVAEKTQTLSYEAWPSWLCGLSALRRKSDSRLCAFPIETLRPRSSGGSTAPETDVPRLRRRKFLESRPSPRWRSPSVRAAGLLPASWAGAGIGSCRPRASKESGQGDQTEPVMVRNAMQRAGDYKLKWSATSDERCLPSGNSAHRQSAGARHTVLI